MTTDRCIIIPAAAQAKAQALCKGLAGPAGDGMFVVGLSASGNAPARFGLSGGVTGLVTHVARDWLAGRVTIGVLA